MSETRVAQSDLTLTASGMLCEADRFSRRPLTQALSAALLIAPAAASAATIQVTSNSNGPGAPGQCTLRSAVYAIGSGATNSACSTATGTFGTADTITFAAGITLINFDSYGGGITTPSNRAMTIQGTGFGGVTLQRTSSASTAFPIVRAANCGVQLTLDGLTIEGGAGSGGVYGQCYGGNISINNSVIRNNSSSGWGGGVSGYGGRITISNSTISGNTSGGNGGGVSADGAFDISNSTISGNTAVNWGGGAALNAWVGSASRVVNSTISGNTVGNYGAGLAVTSSSASGVQLYSNTMANNVVAAMMPGAPQSASPKAVAAAAGNAFNCYGGSIVLTSSLAWGNSGSDVHSDSSCGSTSLTGSNNLFGTSAGTTSGLTNSVSADPLLGPLANNGGNTLTHALGVGSPAINAGTNPSGLTTDQRGSGFARVVGGFSDIGAFEVAAAPLPPSPAPVPAAGVGALLAGGAGIMVSALGALRRRRRADDTEGTPARN